MTSSRSSAASSACRLAHDERGQSTVEAAIVLPLVLLVLIAAVQFALVHHARNVAETAAEEGARYAAAEGRSPAEGATRAMQVLASGLGGAGERFAVEAADAGESVVVRTQGEYPLFIPWITGRTIAIDAGAEVRKEGFRGGP